MSLSKIRLGEIAKVIPGYAFKSADFQAKGDYPVVKIKNITEDYRVDFSDCSYINSSIINERLTKFLLKEGDILIAMTGATVGKVGKIREELTAVLNQRVSKIEPISVSNDYLWSILANESFSKEVYKTADGAAQANISNTQIENILVPFLEDTDEREWVAKNLGDLDRKIELNRRMNGTLEQIGQTLFKKYFVDNPESEEWSVGQISDFAHHSKATRKPHNEQAIEFLHYSLPAYDNGQKPESVKGVEILSNKFSVLKTSILVSKLNPNTPRVWLIINPAPNAICSTEFVCLETEDHFSFVYFLINSEVFKSTMTAAAGGTSNSHKRVSPSFITTFTFKTPPKDLLAEFENATKDLLVTINKNIAENQMLAEMRDIVLPKLMSGELLV